MRPYLTIEEARKRICPLKLAPILAEIMRAGSNGCKDKKGLQILATSAMTCNGPGCMWWGWDPKPARPFLPGVPSAPARGRCEAR